MGGTQLVSLLATILKTIQWLKVENSLNFLTWSAIFFASCLKQTAMQKSVGLAHGKWVLIRKLVALIVFPPPSSEISEHASGQPR